MNKAALSNILILFFQYIKTVFIPTKKVELDACGSI